jgi:hypothetical protein
MGFTRLIVPAASVDPADAALAEHGCQLVGIRTVGEALDALIA